MDDFQTILDAIRANAVETNLQIQELRKVCMQVDDNIRAMIAKLCPPEPEVNDEPIDYPTPDYIKEPDTSKLTIRKLEVKHEKELELEMDEGQSDYHG